MSTPTSTDRTHPTHSTHTVVHRHEPSPAVAYLLWLCCLVAFCGIHRFYTGRWITGLIWVFTVGLLGVGQLVDLFLIPGQCRNPKW